MNERERWVVYPLLFLALGASLRDKFLKHVTTDEIECQHLMAKSIVIMDPANPNQRLIEMGAVQPAAELPGQPSTRYGVLILRDSSGNELCGVSNNELYVRTLKCEGLTVIDPDNPTRALAALTSAAVNPVKPGDPPQRFGVLALNNQAYGQLVGVPPVNRPALPPAANPAEAEGENPPAGEPSRNGAGR